MNLGHRLALAENQRLRERIAELEELLGVLGPAVDWEAAHVDTLDLTDPKVADTEER